MCVATAACTHSDNSYSFIAGGREGGREGEGHTHMRKLNSLYTLDLASSSPSLDLSLHHYNYCEMDLAVESLDLLNHLSHIHLQNQPLTESCFPRLRSYVCSTSLHLGRWNRSLSWSFINATLHIVLWCYVCHYNYWSMHQCSYITCTMVLFFSV